MSERHGAPRARRRRLLAAGPVALAHRRLTIIDFSEAGAQPMVDSELGLSLVFNGCIYNYRELRAELESAGYNFFSHSDTEVILKAYHRWGRTASSTSTACSRSRSPSATGVAWSWRATGSASSRSTSRARRAPPLCVDLAGPRRRRRRGHHDRPRCLASLHDVPLRRPGAPDDLQGVRKLPPATVRTVERDGTETDDAVLGAVVHAPARGRCRPATGKRPCSRRCASR